MVAADKRPDWAKFEARKNTLCKSAGDVASYINSALKKEYKIERDVVFSNSEIIETLVGKYYELLVIYKKKHGYPEERRINNSKIAGIFLYVVLRDGLDDLFIIKDKKIEDNGLRSDIVTFFCWHFVCSFVGADLEFVKDYKKRRLFESAIVNLEANIESGSAPDKISYDFSCAVFEWFRDAYGNKEHGLAD